MSDLRRLVGEFGVATMLLTRLPAAWMVVGEVSPGRAVWAYPLVGALVGGIGAAALWLGRAIGLPPALAAVWTLVALALVTGALHEDGLADTADGFGGGATRARKLEIMRDSRIGTYGVVALLLSFAARGGALAVIGPVSAVIVASVVGRAAMVGMLCLLPPARSEGLAAGLGAVPVSSAAVAVAIAAAVALLLLPFGAAAAVLVAATAASLGAVWLASRQIGGYTGDVCGAAEQGAECLAFTAMAVSLAR